MSPWLIVGLIGLGTYLTRLSFVAAFGRFGVPAWLAAPLRYVGPAVLAALVAPAVIAPDDAIDVTPGNPRFFAALVALLVAVRTKSVSWTIVAGMGALWLLQVLW
jgi:branched-subunit amino acid transport protein